MIIYRLITDIHGMPAIEKVEAQRTCKAWVWVYETMSNGSRTVQKRKRVGPSGQYFDNFQAAKKHLTNKLYKALDGITARQQHILKQINHAKGIPPRGVKSATA